MTDNDIQFWINHVKNCNPYPSDVFTPPTEEEIKKAAQAITNAGLITDRIFGWWGRKVWSNCIGLTESFLLPDAEIDKRNI